MQISFVNYPNHELGFEFNPSCEPQMVNIWFWMKSLDGNAILSLI